MFVYIYVLRVGPPRKFCPLSRLTVNLGNNKILSTNTHDLQDNK